MGPQRLRAEAQEVAARQRHQEHIMLDYKLKAIVAFYLSLWKIKAISL